MKPSRDVTGHREGGVGAGEWTDENIEGAIHELFKPKVKAIEGIASGVVYHEEVGV